MKRFLLFILSACFVSNSCYAIETAETVYAKAYGNIYKNNTKEAVKIFEKAIQTYPDAAFLYAGMGDAYLQCKDYKNALNAYTTAQKKPGAINNYKIDFYNAHVTQTSSDIQNALNSLLILTKTTDNIQVTNNIKLILQENYTNLSFITELYSDNDNAELANANKIKMSGNPETALKEYLKILNKNPKCFQAANNAGVTLLELHDYVLAEKYLHSALDNNSNSALILNNLAVANSYTANYADMELNFNNATKINASYPPLVNNIQIAKIKKDLSFYKAANLDSILNIIKHDNENYYASRTLAKIYFLKGDFKSANDILKPIISDYNFKLYTQKAYMAFMDNDLKNALTYINKAISLYSDNGNDYLLRARIYSASGMYNEAKADYQRALTKNNTDLTVYYYKALTLRKNSDNSSADLSMREFLTTKKADINKISAFY